MTLADESVQKGHVTFLGLNTELVKSEAPEVSLFLPQGQPAKCQTPARLAPHSTCAATWPPGSSVQGSVTSEILGLPGTAAQPSPS